MLADKLRAKSMKMDGHYAHNSGKLQRSKTVSQNANTGHAFNNYTQSIKYRTMYKY